ASAVRPGLPNPAIANAHRERYRPVAAAPCANRWTGGFRFAPVLCGNGLTCFSGRPSMFAADRPRLGHDQGRPGGAQGATEAAPFDLVRTCVDGSPRSSIAL